MIEADILLRGGTIIAVDPQRRIIENGAVAIAGNRIIAVGTAEEITATTTARQTMDTAGHAILPGLIDGHGHAGHGLVKTLHGGDALAWYESCRRIYTTASPPSSASCSASPPASRCSAAATA